MAALGVPLLVHGEVTDDAVDMFDREAVFIATKLVGGGGGGWGWLAVDRVCVCGWGERRCHVE
jgi:hypothetical protein